MHKNLLGKKTNRIESLLNILIKSSNQKKKAPLQINKISIVIKSNRITTQHINLLKKKKKHQISNKIRILEERNEKKYHCKFVRPCKEELLTDL